MAFSVFMLPFARRLIPILVIPLELEYNKSIKCNLGALLCLLKKVAKAFIMIIPRGWHIFSLGNHACRQKYFPHKIIETR